MSDVKKSILDDEFMSKINGGVLPVGWEDTVSGSIVAFLKMSDQELKEYGCVRSVDSLVATLDDTFQRNERLTNEDMDKLREFVRNKYPELAKKKD